MKKANIYLVIDANECHDVKTGKPVPFYTYNGEDFGESKIIGSGDDVSAEQLAGLCDHDAENCNAHDFVGTHRLLGSLLCRMLGRLEATKIMLEIAERRGLHGMSGLCGLADSYADLAVGEAGHDWDGTFRKRRERR